MESLDTRLTNAIFTVSRLLRENTTYSSHMIQLSMLQLQTLLFLKKRPNSQMSEIAQTFKIELPSATHLINKLATIKLVVRKTDEKDRRLVRISLTKQGLSILEEAAKEKTSHIEQTIAFLSEKDKADFLRILTTIIAKFNKIYEK